MIVPELVATIPLFSDLPLSSQRALGSVMHQQAYRPGQYLVQQNGATEGLFAVRDGRVRLARIGPDSREQVLTTCGPGAIFNLEALFDGGTTPLNARALSQVRALLLPAADVVPLLHEHPAIALLLLRELSAAQRELMLLLEDLRFRSVRGRLARVLLREAPDGKATMTQQELAERAGTVREIAGRTLRDMQQAGLVRLQRGQVVVLDVERLKAVVEEGE